MSRNHLWAWVGVVCVVCAAAVYAQQDQTASDGGSASASVAAVPRLIKFSGTVRDARGEPLTGVALRLTFAVYEEQQGGAALWAESQVAQLDEQGHYSVLLGATRADGLPVELFPAGKARWLGVQVEGRDEDSRVLLVSVPYALKAEDAAMLGGRSAADFVLGEQLKDEVRTQVQAQTPGIATQAVEMLVSNPPKAPAIDEGPSTFTCATTGNCVTVTQSGTGRAMGASANSSNEAILVQQNGTGYGLRALSPGNVALYGQITDSAGTSYGVKGLTTSTTGAGVFGYNLATTGLAYGVLGQTASTEGTAFFGRATATTGATIGLRGHADSTSGTGIMGQATATSGTTTGLVARVFSVDGTALLVDNTQGGKLLSGQVNGVEKLSVDGSGNVTTSGSVTATSFAGSGSALTALNASNLASGTVSSAVISGTYSNAVTFSNGNNTFTGSGAALTSLTAANISAGTAGISITGNAATATSATTATTATNATNLNGVPGSSYARLDTGNSFTGNQTITGNVGIGTAAGTRRLYVVSPASNLAAVRAIGQTASNISVIENQIGVWGDSAVGSGLLGTSNSGAAITGYSNTSSQVATAYFQNFQAGGRAFIAGGPVLGCAIFGNGTMSCGGGKAAEVGLSDGRKVLLYAVESPQLWFEDFGSGALVGGVATVTLDEVFADTVNADMQYHVFLTPLGDCEGLYVASLSPKGFEVRELRGGKSDVPFDYRVVAHRKGWENVRLTDVTDSSYEKARAGTLAAASGP